MGPPSEKGLEDGLVTAAAASASLPDTPLSGEDLTSDQSRLRVTVVAASLSLFCLGYNTAIIAGAQKGIQKDPRFAALNSGWEDGALVSCILAGASIGALSSQAADAVGRRGLLLVTAIIYTLSPLCMAAAPTPFLLLAARTIAGVAVGLSSCLVNLYISEVAPAESRGKFGGWAPLLGTTGTLASYGVSAVLEGLPDGAWRIQLGFAAVPAMCQLMLAGYLPETPRWLLTQGRREDAEASLATVFPKATPSALHAELNRLEEDLPTSTRRVQIWQLPKKYGRGTIVGVAINFLQQVSGINVVVYFGPKLLSDAGLGDLSVPVTFFVTVAQLCATMILVGLVDKVGRRPLAMIGIVIMMFGLGFLMTAYLLAAGSGLSKVETSIVAVLGMLVYRSAFSLSLGPLPYIMTSEFFGQEARAAGVALCWAANWSANFGVSQSFPMIQKALPGDTWTAIILGFYCIACVFALFFAYFLLPETRGLRLEAMQAPAPAGDAACQPARGASAELAIENSSHVERN